MAETSGTSEKEKNKRIEFKRPGYHLVFELTPDADLCMAQYEPVAGGAPLTRDELVSYLGQLKISEGVRDESVSALTIAAVQGKPVTALPLAVGTPMIPGEHGRIALASQLTQMAETNEQAKSSPDAEPQIVDFHHVQDFINVNAGDLIGKVLPPGPGTPGRSIMGSVIPPVPGKSFALKLGKNASYGEDNDTIIADIAGRVSVRGEEISVEDIYQIAGDVNFKTGNIDFNGYVEIRGDILDGFSVKAKGIKVQGNIGTCQITCAEDLVFCGMNGQGKGTITCGGSIVANFIYDSVVACAGDLIIEAEIRSSSIHSLGAVKIAKGGIAGGECIALAGVEASLIGCVSSLHTNIIVGVSYRDLEDLNHYFNELKALIARFNATQKTDVDPQKFQQERKAITESIHGIRERSYERTNPKVNVRKMLYGGVTLTLGTITEEIREEREGPFSVIENKIDGGFRYLGMTDLAFKAADIEQTFLQQQALQSS